MKTLRSPEWRAKIAANSKRQHAEGRSTIAKVVPIEIRFWAKVHKTETCWNWTGHIRKTGYGGVSFNGKHHTTHSVSWELHYGEIPKGMCVCHHCDNRKCVRPDHLFLGTPQDNSTDAVLKGRTKRKPGWVPHCPKATLTKEQVLEIRSSDLDYRVLAAKYGVGRNAIYEVKQRRTWRHV